MIDQLFIFKESKIKGGRSPMESKVVLQGAYGPPWVGVGGGVDVDADA